MFLRSLAYLIEQDEQYPILDVQGTETGQLSVSLTPCNSNGKEILGEFVEDPNELVGKNLGFKVKILAATGLPRRLDEVVALNNSNLLDLFRHGVNTDSMTKKRRLRPKLEETTLVMRMRGFSLFAQSIKLYDVNSIILLKGFSSSLII